MDGSRRTANPTSSVSFTDAELLTFENSKEVLCQSDECAKWTNEKHNLFLNFLEASFVKQMHKSITLQSRYPEQNKVKSDLSQKPHAKINQSSKQLPVVGDFHWPKIKIKRDLADLDSGAVSHCSFKDQQICLFSHSDTQMLGFAEGSDQNFVDEGHEENDK